MQQKQNYPDSVTSYDTQPGNEVDLFYNGPEHHTGQTEFLTTAHAPENGQYLV